jgi:uncharacterized membrane protein
MLFVYFISAFSFFIILDLTSILSPILQLNDEKRSLSFLMIYIFNSKGLSVGFENF